ncbi:hypothetical protein ACXWQV_10140, partial [Streptococcus pyogenes]
AIIRSLISGGGIGALASFHRLGADTELVGNPVVKPIHLRKRNLELPLVLQVQPAFVGNGAHIIGNPLAFESGVGCA